MTARGVKGPDPLREALRTTCTMGVVSYGGGPWRRMYCFLVRALGECLYWMICLVFPRLYPPFLRLATGFGFGWATDEDKAVHKGARPCVCCLGAPDSASSCPYVYGTGVVGGVRTTSDSVRTFATRFAEPHVCVQGSGPMARDRRC